MEKIENEIKDDGNTEIEIEATYGSEKRLSKEGYIKRYHLYYLLSIAGIIIALLTSFIFKSSEFAGEMLSFAATLSSILLAVIAIVITLIDVAGQRNNILDVKNSVEELKTVSGNITVIVEEFEIRNKLRDDEILSFITQINKYNKSNSKKFDDIAEKLNRISATGQSKDDVEKIKQELEMMKNNIEFPRYRFSPDNIKSKPRDYLSLLERLNIDYKENMWNQKE